MSRLFLVTLRLMARVGFRVETNWGCGHPKRVCRGMSSGPEVIGAEWLTHRVSYCSITGKRSERGHATFTAIEIEAV